jgi:Zn-dependent protease with chaperone function
MDFFQRQDDARRRTMFLLIYFGLGILSLVVMVYALCAFLFLYLNAPADQPKSFWDPTLLLTVCGGVTAVVGGGSAIRAAQLSAGGGKSVALMMNGQEVQGNTTDLKERRLLNVVEEMAIAAGVPVPAVYLLPDENGINAFAAGHEPGDAVIAVSKGCLTYLTRDELQGVVGHEFSHILNGDMRLNLRVIGLIFGIVALSQIGYLIIRTMPMRRSSRDDRGDSASAIFLLGVGLYLLGMGGAFFGWLIQAAVSRQREFLADASAVQFTRNPEGIGGALKKIGGLDVGSRIQDGHAGEIGHMFVSDAFMGLRLSRLFATHPPLAERIRRVDPQFQGVYPEVRPVTVSPEEAKGPIKGHIPNIFKGLPQLPAMAATTVADAAVAQVGRVRPQHLTYAHDLHIDVPRILLDAIHSPFSARALIYAMLLDPDPALRQRQLAQLQSGAKPADFAEMTRLAESVSGLPLPSRLPLVDATLPALRQMSPAQHQEFRTQANGLIHADNEVSLYEYALHCMLTSYLDAAFEKQNTRVSYTRRDEVAAPVAVVLSHLAWDEQEDESVAASAFAVGMQIYSGGDMPPAPLRPREQRQLTVFHVALQVLAQATPEIKRQIVAGCAACIQSDQQVTIREGELLRAICATLGCPMPPLIEEYEVSSDGVAQRQSS